MLSFIIWTSLSVPIEAGNDGDEEEEEAENLEDEELMIDGQTDADQLVMVDPRIEDLLTVVSM